MWREPLRVFGVVVSTALLLACAGVEAAPPPGSPSSAQESPTPSDLVEQVARSSAIGRQLYVLDKVSAIATDTVLGQVPDPDSRGLAGYIPIGEADADGRPTQAFVVSFFTRDAPPRVAYEVRLTPDTKPALEAFSPPKEILGPLVSLIRARQAALELPTRAPAGTSAAALAVSHLVTDFPLETHVFASLLNKLPIYVVTRRGYWCVDGDRIRFLGDHPPSDRQ